MQPLENSFANTGMNSYINHMKQSWLTCKDIINFTSIWLHAQLVYKDKFMISLKQIAIYALKNFWYIYWTNAQIQGTINT